VKRLLVLSALALLTLSAWSIAQQTQTISASKGHPATAQDATVSYVTCTAAKSGDPKDAPSLGCHYVFSNGQKPADIKVGSGFRPNTSTYGPGTITLTCMGPDDATCSTTIQPSSNPH
jgi:hypothetical protein